MVSFDMMTARPLVAPGARQFPGWAAQGVAAAEAATARLRGFYGGLIGGCRGRVVKDACLQCTYCGELGDTQDHVVPVSWNFPGRVGKARWQGYTVPSCRQCNSWLGNKPLHTISARCEYIVEKLARKIRRKGGVDCLSDRSLGLAARLHYAKRALAVFMVAEDAIARGEDIPRC